MAHGGCLVHERDQRDEGCTLCEVAVGFRSILRSGVIWRFIAIYPKSLIFFQLNFEITFQL